MLFACVPFLFFCFLLFWGSEKFKFIASFCSGEAKNSNLLLPFVLGKRKIQIYCFLLFWGSEKFKFIASFCSGEAKNSNLLAFF